MNCLRCGSEVNETRSGISVCKKRTCKLVQWYTADWGAVAYRSAPNRISLIYGALITWDEVEV